MKSAGPALIQLTINGAPRQIPQHFNLTQLLVEMQLANKRVAVECNGEIVPRSQYAALALMHGDRLEIVVAVGGG